MNVKSLIHPSCVQLDASNRCFCLSALDSPKLFRLVSWKGISCVDQVCFFAISISSDESLKAWNPNGDVAVSTHQLNFCQNMDNCHCLRLPIPY